MLVGDDAKRIAEAEQLARREIGCRVLRTSAYFQPEGHVQVEYLGRPVGAARNGHPLPLCSAWSDAQQEQCILAHCGVRLHGMEGPKRCFNARLNYSFSHWKRFSIRPLMHVPSL